MYQFATLLLLIQTKPRRQWTCDLHTEFSLTGWFACIIIHHNTCWFGALQRFGPETKQTHTKVEIILYIYLLYLLVIEWSSFNVKPHCPLFLYKNSPLPISSVLPSAAWKQRETEGHWPRNAAGSHAVVNTLCELNMYGAFTEPCYSEMLYVGLPSV